MNIYNFIYCFFYKFWEKRGNDGRIVGSGHVLGTVIIHILLLSEIIQDITGFKIVSLPNYGGSGSNKYMYFLFSIPFFIALWLYYNRKRSKTLLKEYYQKYGETGVINTIKMLLYLVFPAMLLITLAVIRQRLS